MKFQKTKSTKRFAFTLNRNTTAKQAEARLGAGREAAALLLGAHPEEIAFGASATQLAHFLARALAPGLEPGDEVLIPAPFWPTFLDQALWAGGVPKVVPPGEDGIVSVSTLEQAAGDRTRVMILNSPVNPSGRVLGVERARNAKVADLDHVVAVLALLGPDQDPTEAMVKGLFTASVSVVPFTGHQHAIVRRLQNFGESHVIASSLEIFFDLVGVKPGEERGPCGHTNRVVVEMSESHPVVS